MTVEKSINWKTFRPDLRAYVYTPNQDVEAVATSVDCVRVLRDSVVVSGSRDRGINLWTTAGLEAGQSSPTSRLPDAHKGWVWSFSSPQQDQAGQLDLVSGSWDNTVKVAISSNSS